MIFMSYRPKTSKNVKAERITEANIDEIAASFSGTAKVIPGLVGSDPKLKIATLDGVLECSLGDWVVRTDEGVELWRDAEFNEKYERARNTRDGQ